MLHLLSHIGNFKRFYPELCNDKNGIDEGYENISQQLDKYGPCIQSSEEEVLAIVFFLFPCYGIGGRNSHMG